MNFPNSFNKFVLYFPIKTTFVSIWGAKLSIVETQREHRFYVQLIPSLAVLYPTIDKAKVEKLNVAAYAYFRFLLSLDNLIDSTSKSDKQQALQNTLTGFSEFENGIRLLSELYQTENLFWETFNELKKGYFKAIITEKSLSVEQPNISEQLFQQIAIGKSSMCHNSVYALQYLANDKTHEAELISCVNHIHIAFQYLDDIDDFKSDIREKQWTYPQSLLRDYLKENNIQCDNETVAHKYLFLSEIAQGSTKKAIEHYQIALEIAQNLGLDELSKYIEKQISSCHFYLNEVAFLFEKTRIISSKSRVLVADNTLTNAIENALNYVEANQNEDGSWSDFMTSAGTGKAWVTGYVGSQIAAHFPESPALQKTKKLLAEDVTSLLSYNDSIFQDGDSTTFILALTQQLNVPNQEISENWFNYFHSSGGWRTYIHEEPLRKRLELPEDISVAAWISPKACVSAAAATVLKEIDQSAFNKTAAYLVKNINSSGYWESYWWTSPVYATAYAIIALKDSSSYISICENACNWLLSQQQPDGSWLNPPSAKPNAFYTALALNALLTFDKITHQAAIEKGVNWLQNNQTTDGSWQTDRILQIPATDVGNPQTVKHWRNCSFGVNCITDDHNRVFTTSAVLNFLATYQKSTQC